ncbi:hypothetical protein GN956_G12496 [Arapaima gigas]
MHFKTQLLLPGFRLNKGRICPHLPLLQRRSSPLRRIGRRIERRIGSHRLDTADSCLENIDFVAAVDGRVAGYRVEVFLLSKERRKSFWLKVQLSCILS